MELSINQVVLMFFIMGVAGIAQTAIGFGYALFTIAPLVWLGLPVPSAIALVGTCTLIQTALGARELSSEIDWPLVLKGGAVRLIFVIVGLFLLKTFLSNAPVDPKGVVGAILCLLVLLQFLWRPKPVDSMHMGWGVVSWIASGLISGFCGMGGPPLVLWSMAHTWSSAKTRGYLFAIFAITSPLQLILLAITFGAQALWFIALGIAFFPAVYAGCRIGMPIGSSMDKDRLRKVALIVLFLIGLAAVAQTVMNSK